MVENMNTDAFTTIEQVLTPLLTPVLPMGLIGGATMTQTEHWMLEAVHLALKGWGGVSPNPLVGAIIIAPNGEIIGKGWHAQAGKPHAEPNAIDAVNGAIPHGSTMVVTLEPCNHWGQTPPCTRTILQTGITTVIVGCTDTNPQVAGTGIEALRCAGITVKTGVLEGLCQQINRPFFNRLAHQRPFVAVKFAQTLDGKLATRQGHSQWVTSQPARTWVHGMRAGFDALLTSASTVAADNPLFTCRHPNIQPLRQPVRVVLDTMLRLNPQKFNIFDTSITPTWVCYGAEAPINIQHFNLLQDKGVKLLAVPRNATGTGLQLSTLLQVLRTEGITSVWVEGGGTLTSSFLQQPTLVDDIYAIVAPKLLGDAGAIPSFTAPKIAWQMPSVATYTLYNVQPLGEDALLIMR
jgi:diaminohydroxyphosphoribosylaminopyrimidine deaminase/5-amino-6-(5-phosphoribosylamino)uracil reductase